MAKRGRKKGTPKTGGRQKGTSNKVTVEAKLATAEIVDNPKYRRMLMRKAIAGKLHPAIESMLWHYSKGKPKDHVELSGSLAVEQKVVETQAKGLSDEALEAARQHGHQMLAILQGKAASS